MIGKKDMLVVDLSGNRANIPFSDTDRYDFLLLGINILQNSYQVGPETLFTCPQASEAFIALLIFASNKCWAHVGRRSKVRNYTASSGSIQAFIV